MKTYEQMANDALRRIEEYETERRERRKVVARVAVPVFSFCLVALLGLGLWKSGILGNDKVPVIDDGGQGQQTETADPSGDTEKEPESVSQTEEGSQNGTFQPVDDPDGHAEERVNQDPSGGSYESNAPAEEKADEPVSGEQSDDPEPEPQPVGSENDTPGGVVNVGPGEILNGDPNGIIQGPDQPTGEEPHVVQPSYQLIEDYPNAPQASYATPGMGEVGKSVPLTAAMQTFGEEGYRYRVVIDFFDGSQIIRDKDTLLAEADRLYKAGGYTAGVETVIDNEKEVSYLFLIATAEQINSFPARSDRGYFMFLIREYQELTDQFSHSVYGG